MTGPWGAPLDWDRPGRVTPAQTAQGLRPRLGGRTGPSAPAASQEAWPEAEPLGRILPLARAVVERRQAGGLRLSPPPRRKVRRLRQHACRRSASLFRSQREKGRSLALRVTGERF